jgi:AraC family cel operon transcriptional repressor
MVRFHFRDYVSEADERFYLNDLVAGPGETVAPHFHDYYEYFVVLRGAFEEECDGARTLVSQRQAHILGPERAHCLTASASHEISILRNIAVEKESFERISMETGLPPTRLHRYFMLDSTEFSAFCGKSDLCLMAYRNGQPFDFLLRSVTMDMLIGALMRIDNDRQIPAWLRTAYEALQRDGNYVQGLPRLIELAGKPKAYLARAFQKYYQMSPSSYVNMLRMQQASWLLQMEDEKIIDIAYACGYNNISYFNRVFLRQYGMTPRAYRERKNFFFEMSI